jgi:3,4-dihydroxy 2-butanone 4-phosphate synthase/GTP cyclohydrolase II
VSPARPLGLRPDATSVAAVCSARLPTRFGEFTVSGYRSLHSDEEFVAVWTGALRADVATLVRIHSQCLTGEVFGSLRCDCASQLETSLRLMQAEGRGVVVYQFQEGRGIGIINKIRAYALQDGGADTVQANERLGLQADARAYRQCAEILLDLGVRDVRAITNNPQKLDALRLAGLQVVERVALPFVAEEPARGYLQTKRDKLGHLPPAAAPAAVPNDHDQLLQELFRARRSCVAFDERELEPELLRIVLGAARHAPSSFNEQPWRFVVTDRTRDPQAFGDLLSCLSAHNAVWARSAPVLVLSVAQRAFADDGRLNRHALHDVGLAVANVTLQATALDLAVHQMGGFDMRRAQARFHVPAAFAPVTVIAIGHRAPDAAEPAPAGRRGLDEIVHWGDWGAGRGAPSPR